MSRISTTTAAPRVAAAVARSLDCDFKRIQFTNGGEDHGLDAAAWAASIAALPRSRAPHAPERGLSAAEAAHRLAEDGPKTLPGGQRRSLWSIAAETVREPMFLLLLAAGTL